MISFNDALSEVLRNPKYNILTGRSPDMREQINNILGNIYYRYVEPFLSRLRFPQFETHFSGSGLLIAIFAVCTIAFAIVAVYLTITHRRKKGIIDGTTSEIIEGLLSKRTTIEQLFEEAAAFSEKKQYREAVRLQFIALLWIMHRRSLISLTDTKTNSMLKREVKENSMEFYPEFCEIVELFNCTWFGFKPLSAEKYEDNRISISKLIGAVGGHETNV